MSPYPLLYEAELIISRLVHGTLLNSISTNQTTMYENDFVQKIN
jgi:hypothetical protein